IRRAAPIVGDGAVRKMRVDLARVHRAAAAHEVEESARPGAAVAQPTRWSKPRMHRRPDLARQGAVGDEEVLFDRGRGITPPEVAGAVAFHAVRQDQVLGARGRADRIRLHEAEAADRVLERGRREQRTGGRVGAQLVECRHRESGTVKAGRLAVKSRACQWTSSSSGRIPTTWKSAWGRRWRGMWPKASRWGSSI